MSKKAIHEGVRMGHVHLKVADLERALRFYQGVLGFEVTQKMGNSAAFLSAGRYPASHPVRRGRVRVAKLLRKGPRDCTIWQLCTLHAQSWRMRFAA